MSIDWSHIRRILALSLVLMPMAPQVTGASEVPSMNSTQPNPVGPREQVTITPDPPPPPAGFTPPVCEAERITSYATPTTTLVAAFYFPWYVEDAPANCVSPPSPEQLAWCRCYLGPKAGNPKPLDGYYRSDDEAAILRHLDRMANNGVNIVALEWSGADDITENIENHVIPMIELRPDLKFIIVYDLDIRFNNGVNPPGLDFSNAATRLMASQDLARFAGYFQHGQYLKIDDQPVLYLYLSRAIGGPNDRGHVDGVFTSFANNVKTHFPEGPYIVADHLWWQGTDHLSYLSAIGASAVTAFGPMTPDPIFPEYPNGVVPQNASAQPMRKWADQIAGRLHREALYNLPALVPEGSYDINPGITVQYDDTGFGSTGGPTPEYGLCYDPLNPRVVQKYHLSGDRNSLYASADAGSCRGLAIGKR